MQSLSAVDERERVNASVLTVQRVVLGRDVPIVLCREFQARQTPMREVPKASKELLHVWRGKNRTGVCPETMESCVRRAGVFGMHDEQALQLMRKTGRPRHLCI